MRDYYRRTAEDILAEINETLGFIPPFFEPASAAPEVLNNLWQQTRTAYLDNPFSTVFKERLNAYLSRYCAIPYCMICHSCMLPSLGMSAQQVLKLLYTPALPSVENGFADILPLSEEKMLQPVPDSCFERLLLSGATAIFLELAGAAAIRQELARVIGPNLYQHLVAYLAYIKTCHLWAEAHPEISVDLDKRVQDYLPALLAQEPGLANFFRTYQRQVKEEQESRALTELQEEHNARMAAERQEMLEHQRRFLKDVLASVTDGRLCLCDHPDQLPSHHAMISHTIPLAEIGSIRAVRRHVEQTARSLNFDEKRIEDLAMAIGEATMNAVVHGGGGHVHVHTLPQGHLHIWVTDHGKGIPVEKIPKATLKKGYTTAGSFGHGFKMILAVIDRVWLLTGPQGTTVVLEHHSAAPEPEWMRQESGELCLPTGSHR